MSRLQGAGSYWSCVCQECNNLKHDRFPYIELSEKTLSDCKKTKPAALYLKFPYGTKTDDDIFLVEMVLIALHGRQVIGQSESGRIEPQPNKMLK